MSYAFQPIPANVTFGQLREPGYASDYIHNKKSLITYCNGKTNFNCKKSF